MLEIRDLTVSYGLHKALQGVSLTADKGEVVVILGANGAGKSSLLKAVAGISEGAVTGGVTLAGTSLLSLGPDRIVEGGSPSFRKAAASLPISVSGKTCCWAPIRSGHGRARRKTWSR